MNYLRFCFPLRGPGVGNGVTWRRFGSSRLVLICLTAVILCSGQMCVSLPAESADQQNADETPAAIPWEELIGGNDERLIFRKVEAGSERCVAWDVAGNRTEEIQFPQTPWYTDGDWAAWQDDISQTLHAIDLNTGRESQFEPFLGSTNEYVQLRSLHGSRLLGHMALGEWRSFLAVLDLTTGQWQVVLDTVVSEFDEPAIDGDWLAIWYYAPLTDVTPGTVFSPDSPSVSHAFDKNLDAVNLVTGERRSILSGISAGNNSPFQSLPQWWSVEASAGTSDLIISIYPLTVVGNRVVWNAHTLDSTGSDTNTIWAYHLDTGQTEKVLELASNDQDSYRVWAIGHPGILVDHLVLDTVSGAQTYSYELHRFDGQVSMVETIPKGASITSSAQLPQFAGSLIVHQDLTSGAMVIFDPATSTSRSIRPFGS